MEGRLTTSPKILLVDPDDARAKTIAAALQQRGCQVARAAGYFEGLSVVEDFAPQVILLRCHPPGSEVLDARHVALALQLGLERGPAIVALVEQDEAVRTPEL